MLVKVSTEWKNHFKTLRILQSGFCLATSVPGLILTCFYETQAWIAITEKSDLPLC